MLSQSVEYALRAVVHLAALQAGSSASSATIAAHAKIPHGYLSKILRDLVVAKLVNSQRGPNGGFTLARMPAQISLLDVVSAVDPIERITKCPLGNPAHLNLCPLHSRLDRAIGLIERELQSTTLAELFSSQASEKGTCRQLVRTKDAD